MSFLNKFFESHAYGTLKAYAIFLTFLNVPHLLIGLMGKSKLALEAVCQGSSLMLSAQVGVLRQLADWGGTAVGQKSFADSLEKSLAQTFSGEAVSGTLIFLGVLLALGLLHLSIKLFGRFVPALADLHVHHRTTPWSVFYLVLLIGYIFISLT